MNRREFIAVLGGAACATAARAQQLGKLHRVGLIFSTSPVSEMVGLDPIHPFARAFVHRLRDLGYIEGRNLVLEHRSAEGKLDDLPRIIRQVTDQVDVIVSPTNLVTQAAKSVTDTVPIVMAGNGIPVESGFVESLAKPGGNITGLSLDTGVEIFGKRLEIIRELLPEVKRVAWLGPEPLSSVREFVGVTARKRGWHLILAETAPNDYASAFASITQADAQAIFVGGTAINFVNRHLIVDFAARSHVPAIYHNRQFVDAGGLISYGVNFLDLYRRAAGYVDRILKGAKPSNLPVEQPTKFELVINLKTAKALGLEIPPSLLARADEVIE
jgi:putative ABC transport system substrate-binding protein